MSMFIGKLVGWKKVSDNNNGTMEIINISGELFDLLDLTGITHIIDIKKQ